MSRESKSRRRQHGSIRRLPSGRFQARHTDGSGHRHQKTFDSRIEANSFLSLEHADQLRGTWIDPSAGSVILKEFASEWLRQKFDLGPRTQELYEGLLRLHIAPTIGQEQIGKISPAMVRKWFSDLAEKFGPTSPTPAKAYRLLSQVLKVAEIDGLISRNPCNLKGAAVEHAPERPVATIEEVWDLADAISNRYRLLVLLAAWCGFRRGELLALRRTRIDLEGRTISVEEAVKELKSGKRIIGQPKTAAGRRRIAIPEPLLPEIASHLASYVGSDDEAFLFTSPGNDTTLRFSTLNREWRRATETVGVSHLHLHDLRHTAGTLAASTGASTPELMLRLGHSSPQASLRYQHATQQRDRLIADRLGDLMARPEGTIAGADADRGEEAS